MLLQDLQLGPGSLRHPGLLHTTQDLQRTRANVVAGVEPWRSGWEKLVRNPHSSHSYKPQGPLQRLVRGRSHLWEENYGALFHDLAAASQQAIRWKVSDIDDYGRSSASIIISWSETLTEITGNEDFFLAAGLYGYQFANVVELLRDSKHLPNADLHKAVALLKSVFYPLNHDFLVNHVGAGDGYYWANWDLCTILSMLSIGIVSDDLEIANEAIAYLQHGRGSGSMKNMFPNEYEDGTAQGQEAGRDQGHALLDFCELGYIAQTLHNQDVDLFGYRDNLIMRGAEYVARYNLGHDVHFTPYVTPWWDQKVVSPLGRGEIRPIWELLYNHYAVLRKKGAQTKFIKAMRAHVNAHGGGAEGGGGDYGDKSGGFDQLGFGTLLYTLQSAE